MSRDCDRTIGPKTATKRYGGVSVRCSALSQPDRPSGSSASTPPPTTILTFNATWSLDRRFGSSGQKQPHNGAVQRQRHDPRHTIRPPSRPMLLNLTRPLEVFQQIGAIEMRGARL